MEKSSKNEIVINTSTGGRFKYVPRLNTSYYDDECANENSDSKATEYDKNGFEIDYTSSPRFSVNSTTAIQEGLKYFNENGYAVFSDVLSDDEIKTNKNLLWEFLEQLPNSHIDRDKPETWNRNW
ncbi:unnamed protein product [Didymodactylos carnosus]|nr:unnamed protein product [Didymodactylos carnosus]CAF4649582.1 unnamed protein product [Didymodactylos carnosus]